MASLGSSIENKDNDHENINLNIPDVLSDIEEDMTFYQIINKYNEDSMFNSSMLDYTTNADTHSSQSTSDDDTDSTQSRPDTNSSLLNNNTDSKNTENLRCYLEKECFPETEWSNDLIFKASTDKITYQDMDITKYVGENKYKDKVGSGSHRIYFNPKDYSVQQELDTMINLPDDTTLKERVQSKFKSEAYMRLCRDLREASGKCGFHIVQNGNQKSDLKRTGLKIRNRICCLRYCVYKGNKKDITGNYEFRRYTLHNDRKNQRSQGRKKCRRSYSSKSISKDCRCKYFFYIDFDKDGFYVEPGLGNRNHSNHSQLNKHSNGKNKHSIDDNDHSLIGDMADGQAQDSQIQNVIFNKTGKLIPRYTIRQITKFKKRTIVNDSDFKEMFEGKDREELSPTEYMMRYCRARGYNFQLLLNDPQFSTDPTSETYTAENEEPMIEQILDFNDREMNKLKNNVNFGRVAMDLKDEQKYMMSFAWVNPKELYLLEAFPEVIMVDTTEKTNNEKRPLLTAGGKDSNGNMFIFLRVFMPNQQSWMFRWIFSVVFPRLIPKQILHKIKIIITDGDPQEYGQIDNAIETVIPNARRTRCGWHIVHQGFDRYVDTTFPNISSEVVNEHKKVILNWMYSWMKRRCLTYLQYKYSRYLFMKYLYSKEFTDLFGVAFSNNISMFVRQHVQTHENYFLYCHRNNIRHYGEYSNTPLEGTNYGIKHSSISTHPGLSMDNSMVILSVQSDKHVCRTNGKVIQANKKNCVNYKESVHRRLTVMASSMLSNLMHHSSKYDSIRINQNEWLVRKTYVPPPSRKGYIPDFDVIQTVKVTDTPNMEVKQLQCTCQYNEVYGMPCIHSIVVARSFQPNWTYVTHNDVSV